MSRRIKRRDKILFFQCTPGNIFAVLHIFKADNGSCFISTFLRIGNILAHCRNAKHTPACRYHAAVADFRSGMEHNGFRHFACFVKAADRIALRIMFRVTSGSKHYAHGGFIVPAYAYFVKPAGCAGQHNFSKVAVQKRQHNLRFRVAETAVKFNNFNLISPQTIRPAYRQPL